MTRVFVVLFLLTAYAGYSALVYTRGTEAPAAAKLWTDEAAAGKALFQKHNCTACHQLYGLGGYLGPDLTQAWSDPRRGPAFMRALLQSGGSRMPDFHFTPGEVESLLAYLRAVDASSHETPSH
ncbi:cytochrome c [Flaviaesturariibacter flavus]|uniref:Cytochrome c n=1 Tax=Flaviaesturariibacter flavus TaxID=2502780 RepID=A0A4V2NV51_9BACT|nr:cytochrome c [Flaviaesturariibacter flavus]TCJ12126.1 cytochrome c [Flaviaesturariibacter flavus]